MSSSTNLPEKGRRGAGHRGSHGSRRATTKPTRPAQCTGARDRARQPARRGGDRPRPARPSGFIPERWRRPASAAQSRGAIWLTKDPPMSWPRRCALSCGSAVAPSRSPLHDLHAPCRTGPDAHPRPSRGLSRLHHVRRFDQVEDPFESRRRDLLLRVGSQTQTDDYPIGSGRRKGDLFSALSADSASVQGTFPHAGPTERFVLRT